MDLWHLIRRRGTDIALGLLFGAAVLAGGEAAMSGIGVFAEALLPGMAAQAGPSRQDVARLSFTVPFAASRYAPQVLFPVSASSMPDWLTAPVQPALARLAPPDWHAPAPSRVAGRGVIAVCIDDLGEDIAGTDRAIMLPKEVALSFLPYAEATPFLAASAGRKGHTILAHVPMQALGGGNPGPMALMVGMSPTEIARRMEYALNRVPGISGINNHEGSRFTADAAGLVPVVSALKTRGLFFLDSRTGAVSHVEQVSQAAGVETGARDIFLDDDPRPAAVAAQLEELARVARRGGVAIAIGHPRDATLTLLAEWLKRDHGVALVTLQDAMRIKHTRALASR
jgi:polysaccharide deacetylase 2 family uncharacterized protein YibQ